MQRGLRHSGILISLLAVGLASAFPPDSVRPGILRHSDQDRCDPPGGLLPLVAGEFVAEPYHRSRVIYVDQAATGANTGFCWLDAYTDLQDALDEARNTPFDKIEIWVASGVYRPDRGTGLRTSSFDLVDGVEVYGGFSGTESRLRDRNRDPVSNGTILSGDLLGDDLTVGKTDNTYHVVTGTNVSYATILDGFQIIGGLADGADGDADNFEGGGLRLENAGPRIRWVLFYDNLAYSGGAIFSSRSNPILRYVGYLQNGALNGGALYGTNNSILSLEFNNVWDNLALEDGGGLYAGGNSSVTVMHSRFLNNDAVDGGGLMLTGSASLLSISSIYSGNVATQQGGAMLTKGTATIDLVNVTVAANTAATGGGILTDSGVVNLRNSILWSNTAVDQVTTERVQFTPGTGTTYAVDYTCVEGWSGLYGGLHNTGADPQFVDNNGQLGTDLRLKPGSAMIDAGNNDYLDDLDIAGRGNAPPAQIALDVNEDPRLVDDPLADNTGNGQPGQAIVDFGATEYQPGASETDP